MTTKKIKKEQIGFFLKAETKDKLIALAEINELSMSAQLIALINSAYKKELASQSALLSKQDQI